MSFGSKTVSIRGSTTFHVLHSWCPAIANASTVGDPPPLPLHFSYIHSWRHDIALISCETIVFQMADRWAWIWWTVWVIVRKTRAVCRCLDTYNHPIIRPFQQCACIFIIIIHHHHHHHSRNIQRRRMIHIWMERETVLHFLKLFLPFIVSCYLLLI